MDAHYVRREDTKKYLPPGLNMTKLFALYSTWYKEKNYDSTYEAMTKKQYWHVFNKYNIGFYDECSFCIDYSRGLVSKEEYKQHRKLVKTSRECKNRDKADSKEDSSICTAVYDLQKILTCPRSSQEGKKYQVECMNIGKISNPQISLSI